MLDSRAVPGGGAASEELLSPGYLLDSCSTGHTLIQTNPLLVDDELGLLGRYGLEYLMPDPFAHVAFPDGEQLTAWLDVERTTRGDRAVLDGRRARPTGGCSPSTTRSSTSSARRRSRRSASGRRSTSACASTRRATSGAGARRCRPGTSCGTSSRTRTSRRSCSGRPTRRSCPIDAPGSGPLAYSIVFGRQRRSWTLPRGGSGRLTDALVDVHRGPRRHRAVRSRA